MNCGFGLKATEPGQYRAKWKSKTCSKFIYYFKWIKNGSATICNKQNQNRPIRTWDTACQSSRRRYARLMTSRHVIVLPLVTISLVTLYNCFLTVEDYTKGTQEISGTQLPYRLCERRMFVIYSSTRDVRRLCYYLLSCKVAFFHLWKFSQVAILKLEHCSCLHLEAYLYLYNSLWLFFLIRKVCASSLDFKKSFFYTFFQFFRK